jgi:hypothetical protein
VALAARIRYFFVLEAKGMSQAAFALGPLFETVDVTLEKGCSIAASAVLEPDTALEEVPVFSGPARPGSTGSSGGVRAFRVQGDELAHEGLFEGDYILVGPARRPRCGALVLAEANGRAVLRRADSHRAQRSQTAMIPTSRIMGVFLGVIRKRGFGMPPANKPATRLTSLSAAPSKATMLRGQLGMLESTYAETRNPRLQRALRNEAARVRRQLQNEADLD